MHLITAGSFTAAYKLLIYELLESGRLVSPRGHACHELINVGWSLVNIHINRLDFSGTKIPERQGIYDAYLKKELDWYLSGSLRAKDAPAPFWSKIADSSGNITSNYGAMILHENVYASMAAYEHVLRILKTDRDSRQAVMHYNRPEHYWEGNLDVPCTLTAQVLIRENKLHMIVTQRSCDAKFGLSYDVPWHCYVMQRLAADLEVAHGEFHHNIGSLHLYEKDVDYAKKVVG